MAGDRAIARDFLGTKKPPEARYAGLFRYFVEGFLAVATPGFERAQYRGMGSRQGYRISGVEGFARTAPMFAAWLASGRPAILPRKGSRAPVDVQAVLVSGLTHGADPDSGAFWGEIRSNSQLIVEAADIALTLWLGRDRIWPRLSRSTRKALVTWLRTAAGAETPPNNWLLFGVVIGAALCALEDRELPPSRAYDQFRTHYLEHGWFSDRAGIVDYYNAWGIAYPLFWIHRMQPGLDAEFLRQVVLDSGGFTSHLVSPRGIPIMGRSICYRTAAITPIVLRTFVDSTAAWHGLARRALDCSWRYFVAGGALRDGTLTQGYFGDDPRILDPYSGPGSSHWGLRSLIPALLHPEGSQFWSVPERPLPVEQGDFRIDAKKLGWVVKGEQANGEIRITIPANERRQPTLEPYTRAMRIEEAIRNEPRRPANLMAKYGASVYSAIDPFPLRRSGSRAILRNKPPPT